MLAHFLLRARTIWADTHDARVDATLAFHDNFSRIVTFACRLSPYSNTFHFLCRQPLGQKKKFTPPKCMQASFAGQFGAGIFSGGLEIYRRRT